MVRYILHSTDSTVHHELCSRVCTVGRNPGNQLCLPDPSVSSFHAELTVLPDEGGIRIRDLQSTNGTFINKQCIPEGVLGPGDSLQFGTVEFQLAAEKVEIRVPDAVARQVGQPAGSVQMLPDGTLACSRNPYIAATHQALGGCGAVVKCPGYFASSSLRSTRLSGGTAGVLLFCPDCNARCEEIPELASQKKKKSGFLTRLKKTVQMTFSH